MPKTEKKPLPASSHAFPPFIWLIALGIGSALSGCGNHEGLPDLPLHSTKGKVLLANDKPLTGGRIHFLSKAGTSRPASGSIEPDGTFSLKTGDAEGAAAGEYKVRIDPDQSKVPKTKSGVGFDPKAVPFPAQFMDEDGDTGLTATIQAGPNQLEPFKLVPTPKTGTKSRRDND